MSNKKIATGMQACVIVCGTTDEGKKSIVVDKIIKVMEGAGAVSNRQVELRVSK